MPLKPKKTNIFIPPKAISYKLKASAGFTLMEIVVATTIFAFVCTAMLSLFNYTLKINRRSEALRQASQGMRNFAEMLTKEVRNGQIDYYVQGGAKVPTISAASPCGRDVTVDSSGATDTYYPQENKLGILAKDGYHECFYFADENGNYVMDNIFTAPVDSGTGIRKPYQLILEKTGGIKENIIPTNYRIESLKFFIRPVCDPYSECVASYGGAFPRIQPSVSVFIKFVAQLPTGETVPIYYQTSISTNDYNIPSS